MYICKMRPQFFPWLFDDRNAWEKSLASPHYSYELPIDSFMSLYQVERKVSNNVGGSNLPLFTMPLMPMPAAPSSAAAATVPAFVAAANPFAAIPAAVAAPASAETKTEEPKEDGILSQDEIDALLSGI